MELLFDGGQSTNVLRDRTTGILSDILSEVIDRVRSKTGDDMLGVAERLKINRHNTRLHAIPLKDGVTDIYSALREHAASRKRKRTEGSESDNSQESSSWEDVSSVKSCGVSSVKSCGVSSGEVEGGSEDSEARADVRITRNRNRSVANNASCMNKTAPDKPPESVFVTRKSLRQEMLRIKNAEIALQTVAGSESSVEPRPAQPTPPPLIPSHPTPTQPAPPPAPSEGQGRSSKYAVKRNRKLHRNCNKNFSFKLERSMLTLVPFTVDESGELRGLAESECPSNWSVGKERTPVFKRKYFCRRCVLGNNAR